MRVIQREEKANRNLANSHRLTAVCFFRYAMSCDWLSVSGSGPEVDFSKDLVQNNNNNQSMTVDHSGMLSENAGFPILQHQ